MRRFEALDSWRGLCALLVVVFHLNQDVQWSLLDARFIGNFDLFVDFFFVLSGFVIAASYEERLRSGYGVVPFALRRFGRIYPLHLAMLAAMLAYAVARVSFPLSEFDPRAIFDGGIYDFSAIITNALLLHGIGFEHHLTWNYPSWSISAEFFTYLVFATIWATSGRRADLVIFGLVALCPLLLIQFPAESLSVMTLVRCIYGFAAGVLVHHLYRRVGAQPALLRNRFAAAAGEIAALGLCVAFVGWSDGEIWLAPIVFALVVFVFAFEAGPIAAALRLRLFTALGQLSYSIYMVHAVLIFVAWRVVTLLERGGGWMLTSVRTDGDNADRLWATTPWIGDLVMIAMLALVVAVSACTYVLIEKPGREWGRRVSQRWRASGWAGLFARRGENANGPAD